MNLDLQTVVAITLVSLAAVYLSYRAWSMIFRRGSGGCTGGACNTCGNDEAGKSSQFVPIEKLSEFGDLTSRSGSGAPPVNDVESFSN